MGAAEPAKDLPMTDHDDIEPPHAASATDLVQPDPRPLPKNSSAGWPSFGEHFKLRTESTYKRGQIGEQFTVVRAQQLLLMQSDPFSIEAKVKRRKGETRVLLQRAP
jgi:hypothetical protein